MSIKDDDLLLVHHNKTAYKIKYAKLKDQIVDTIDFPNGTTVSPNPPSGAVEGDLWWDEVGGKLYVYYTDANSSQWVETSPTSGIEEAPTDGQQYARQNESWSVVTSGGGGTDTYGGPAAWAEWTRSSGTLKGGYNIAKVTREDTGKYRFDFTTPLPSSTYAALATADQSANVNCTVVNAIATSVTVWTWDSNGTLVDAASNINLVCHSSNAAPPKSGTGADAWVLSTGAGSIFGSFNVSSVQRLSQGTFRVNFITPMPTKNYSVQAIIAESQYSVVAYNTVRETTYFEIKLLNQNGDHFDFNFSAVVHATNATLPFTFTRAEIQSVLDLVKGGFATRIAELEAKVQTLETDHTTLMDNDNGGGY